MNVQLCLPFVPCANELPVFYKELVRNALVKTGEEEELTLSYQEYVQATVLVRNLVPQEHHWAACGYLVGLVWGEQQKRPSGTGVGA